MKANELMIGDIICQKFSNLVLVVSAITPPYVQCIGEEGQFHEDTIKPIPLTPEILEKNGFVEWEDKCYRWEYADGIYINADFTEEEPWAHISNRCYHATPVCRYVHEFQHALRLCGIEKEIVI